MSTLTDIISGGGGGVSGSYISSTAVAATKLKGSKAYPIANDGKIYDIDDGAFAVKPFNDFNEWIYTIAELGDLARAAPGGDTIVSGASFDPAGYYYGDANSDYNTNFLPDGITHLSLMEEEGYGDIYLVMSQDGTSFERVSELFTNGSNQISDYKIMNLPEDSTHYYLAIYVISSGSNHENHYFVVSVAKSDLTTTVLDYLLNGSNDTIWSGTWNINGARRLHTTVNFLSARNGTVFLSTRVGSSSDTRYRYYNWGTHETGAGRTRAIATSYNSSSNPVTNLNTSGWSSTESVNYQFFKISDADGTFLVIGESQTYGTLLAQLLTLDASGGLTATTLTVSGTSGFSANELRYGKFLQTSTSNKFVFFAGSNPDKKAAVVTLDTSANTVTFSSTQTTITFDADPSYPMQTGWCFLHGRDMVLTFRGHVIKVDPTDFSVPSSVSSNGIHAEVFMNQSATGSAYTSTVRFPMYPGSNDYTTIGIGPDYSQSSISLQTVANLIIDYLKIDDVGSLVTTNSNIALVLADTDIGSTATIELASGDTATTSLDSTKFLTKEGMVYPFDTNTDGVPASPATIPSVKSIQNISYSGPVSGNVDISTINPKKSYIIFQAGYDMRSYTLTANTLTFNTTGSGTVAASITIVEGI